MHLRGSFTKGVALASALLLAAAPAAASTSDASTARGTAVTSSIPLLVEAGGTVVELGRTTLTATTDPDGAAAGPWAGVELVPVKVGDQEIGAVSVASDGDTRSRGTTVDRGLPLGNVAATTGDLLATADQASGSATAALTSLATSARVLEGLGLSATVTDVVTAVDSASASATHSLAVTGIGIDLEHLLGGVLGDLPVADLFGIAGALGIDLPVNLQSIEDLIAATEALVAALGDVTTSATAVDAAAEALLTADGGTLAELQALQDEVTTLQSGTLDLAALTSLQTLLTDDLLSSCEVNPTVATLTTDLETVAACLESEVETHIASLTVELDALGAAVTAYTDAVTAAANAATAADAASDGVTATTITDDLLALIDTLAATDLFGMGDIEISQQVRAVGDDLDGSSAGHTCSTVSLEAIGVAPFDLDGCQPGGAELDLLTGTLTDTLQTVLATVGGIETGAVTLELFDVVDDAVAESDGVVTATSKLEVLDLTVPDITITPCGILDGAVCGLGLDLGETLDELLARVGTIITDAEAVVTGALTGPEMAPLLTALGTTLDTSAVDAAAVQTTVDAAVATVVSTLQSLLDAVSGFGTLDQELTVPGARIVVDPELSAEHELIAASAGPAPVDPAPADPVDTPNLPNTGGGAALFALLAIGGGAFLWRRREA